MVSGLPCCRVASNIGIGKSTLLDFYQAKIVEGRHFTPSQHIFETYSKICCDGVKS